MGRVWTDDEISWFKVIEESDFFDTDFYVETYGNSIAADQYPLAHYVETGAYEDNKPNTWFDPVFYKEMYYTENEAGMNPLAHYILYGKKLGYETQPVSEESEDTTIDEEVTVSEGRVWTEEEIEWFNIIEKSGAFDAEYYLELYPDVKASGRYPLSHYIEIGTYERRKPNRWFDPDYYVNTYPDVLESGLEPLVHYIQIGFDEERKSSDKDDYTLILESGLFDENFYLENYGDGKRDDETPLEYFIKVGLNDDHKPNEHFDPTWYREYYEDVKHRNIYPFIHYILFGKSEARCQNASELEQLEGEKENEDQGSIFGPILHNPLVSLIAVNYNGANDMPDFLQSVSEQSYKNFELIIVDNNSNDESEAIVNEYKNKINNLHFIQSGKNLGFAAGNNYALPYCKGELLGLINVDTKLDKEWLKELVDAISVDGDSAAVVSKTYFFERFQDLELTSSAPFMLDVSSLVDSLQYKKYFIRYGEVKDDSILSVDNKIILSLPVQNQPISINIHRIEKIFSQLAYRIGKKKIMNVPFEETNLHLELDYSENNVVNSSYIINNAGSVTQNDMPADRGFGEYDIGQYDNKCYVDFACGVSVLLRRSAIVDRKIFVSEFFAYYEDSELSRWIREQGYKILYTPRSVLYHQHSATSSEGSPLWSLLVTRSRNIYQYNGDYTELFNTNNHFEEYFKPDINESVYKELKLFSKQLRDRLEQNNDIVEKLKPIAIYNSYWNTKGGGESHALAFARVLQQYETVYLVSENDFDIDELAQYYNMDLSNCRKLVEPYIDERFTKKFDIFINSTYRSNLKSAARKSYYIVSFPHRDIDKKILDSYTFLYNSDYTKRWAKRYWGENLKEDIIYPLGMIDHKNINTYSIQKEKIILSVGRFFKGEHSKKQDVIAKAYAKLIEQNEILKEWKLVLIGSLNHNSDVDVNYLNEIRQILKGKNFDIIINASRDKLNSYFEKASIYVHASGYGNDPEKEPHKFEHFGITPVEAMVYGCYPIVYEVGGPAELLQTLHIGDRFKTIEELLHWLNYRISHIKDGEKEQVVFKITKFLEINNVDKKIKRLIKEGL